MKLEETENLKLQYVNRIETNTTHINNIQESDTELIEKITELLNINEKHPNFKGKPSFNKWCNYCRRNGHSISELVTVQENHFRTTQITKGINHHITQVIEVDHANEEIHEISQKTDIIDRIAKITKITIHDQIPIQHNLFLDPVPNQTQGIESIPIINHETHHTTEIETIHIIEIEIIQTIEIRITRTIDQEIIHIIDQTITDQTIIIKTDHKIIHKIETQVTIIDTEIIPSHHTGIITVTLILNIDTELAHHNIKDTLIKCRQMKKQLQTPQVLMTQEVTNYN